MRLGVALPLGRIYRELVIRCEAGPPAQIELVVAEVVAELSLAKVEVVAEVEVEGAVQETQVQQEMLVLLVIQVAPQRLLR
jgi:hypothetical protein